VIRLKQVQHVKQEKDILMSISHPFIVNMVASFQDDRRLYMLMEFVNGGELFSYLRKEGRLSTEASRFYISEIVLAFNYLHDRNIVYRDLKPENILINSDGHLKITDFGFAKKIDSRTWTLCGTPEYLAPEIIQSKGHGKGADWWALGILLFEMIAGYPPFYDENPFGIYQKILTGKFEFSYHFNEASRSLISKLLVSDHSKRLGCLSGKGDDVKKHKFFKNLNFDDLFLKKITPPMIPSVKSNDDSSMFDKYPESVEQPPGTTTGPGLTEKEKLLFSDF
jgi:protein kinase X